MAALEATEVGVAAVASLMGQATHVAVGAHAMAEASLAGPARRGGEAMAPLSGPQVAAGALRDAAGNDGPFSVARALGQAMRATALAVPGSRATAFQNGARATHNTLSSVGGSGGTGGGGPSQTAYQMWGYRPLTDDFEEWETIGQPNPTNPSGQPIVDVTYIRLTCDGD